MKDKNYKLQITKKGGTLWAKAIPLGGVVNRDASLIPEINQTLFQGVQGGGFLEKSPPGRRR
jgi:hypothetical protein